MDLTRCLWLVSMFCCCCVSVTSAKIKDRGFLAFEVPHNPGQDVVGNATLKKGTNEQEFVVGNATAETLKSNLTTVFLPIIYIIVFIVGLPANGMALWVFLFRTKKKRPSSIYLANLALADLLFVIWTPLKIAYHLNGNNWIYGEPLCKVLVSFFYGNMYCSILSITCLSVQRYWVVAHPLSQQSKNTKVAVGMCVSIWAFIWLTTTPLYLYDHTARLKDPNITTCHDVNIIKNLTDPFPSVRLPYYYFNFMAIVVFLIPCVVIVVAYILLLRALGNSMQESTAAKNRHRSRLLIVTVLVTFMVCFIPSNIMLVVHYTLLKNGVKNNGYGFYISTLCLASLNSCLDPFIYYFVSEDFRNHVKNTFLCRSIRTVKRMSISFSSVKYSRKSKSSTSDTGNTKQHMLARESRDIVPVLAL
ncbi:proteinase-activated receptor 2 isoform X2 [Hippoglossus stenolepis]|uniref:proteinase-activated receptor 2 isoform X1 n=1 Tax=Hippoglossus stenolepis TaxID=195615 RepID=UPI001FAFA0CD|nr:proteinase-activated receptor 2 isoform X1 [Hippoglossus stenolepis]XP_035040622.2 proteinase-activated receptor 2 isoform X2 [Hippoglossus stenolepis]